jgi:cyclase
VTIAIIVNDDDRYQNNETASNVSIAREETIMKSIRTLSRIALIAAVVTLCEGANSQGIQYDRTEFITQKLGPNVYVLTGSPGTDPGHPEGAGGRVGVLAGPDGVLMVDASYAPLSDKLTAAIRTISSSPIRFLVDTHEHPDHTGGNPQFARTGALILAREEVRKELSQGFPPAVAAAIGKAASGTDPNRLPVLTYGMGEPLKIRMDDEIVDLIPVRAAHTDGDTIVRFENADVMMIGDFYRNYGYPFIDPAHGGTFKGVLEALDIVMKLAGPKTTLVPGHGTIIHATDIATYRDMILDVQAKVRQMVNDGNSLQKVLSAKLTSSYDKQVPGGLAPLPAGLGTSADRFVAALYAESSGTAVVNVQGAK